MFDYLVTALIALLFSLFSVPFPQELDALPENSEATVVSVTDGDTIKVRIGNKEETVRYIGVDTPEPYRDGEPACFSREATARNKELVEGKIVTLVSDHEDKDKYGRLLRYVYVGERFVNGELIKGGYAKTLRIKPNTTYADEFVQLQNEAKKMEKGMWGACAE